MTDETVLSGGNTNASVVRVGDTVRRAMHPASTTVHRLLQHLRQQGFTAAPAFLGIDKQGREILSFIPGYCDIDESVWSNDKLLISAAHCLRNLHDASALFQRSANDTWGFIYPDLSRHEVICHNDFGLYNLVRDDNACIGIIDFDLAGPGPRLRDIAYAAYWLTPLSQHATDMKPYADTDLRNQCRRLQLFCDTYGVALSAELLEMVSEILHFMGDKAAMEHLFGAAVAARLKRDGHLKHWRSEAEAFDQGPLFNNRYKLPNA